MHSDHLQEIHSSRAVVPCKAAPAPLVTNPCTALVPVTKLPPTKVVTGYYCVLLCTMSVYQVTTDLVPVETVEIKPLALAHSAPAVPAPRYNNMQISRFVSMISSLSAQVEHPAGTPDHPKQHPEGQRGLLQHPVQRARCTVQYSTVQLTWCTVGGSLGWVRWVTV